MNLLNSCDECKRLEFASCCDIEIPGSAGLEADTEYWWKVTDQQGNVWKHTSTTDGDGILLIEQSYFTAGMFQSGVGELKLSIYETCDGEPVTVVFDTQFDCMLISWSQSVEDSDCC